MLFDLRGRGRRRTVQAIYLGLAILMGGGLVLFGIGGADERRPARRLQRTTAARTSVSDSVQEARRRPRRRRSQAQPTDAKAWAELTRVRYQEAAVGDGFDQSNGVFTDKGKARSSRRRDRVGQVPDADRRSPTTPSPSLMVQAFGPNGLNEPDKAVAAMEIVIDRRRPTAALYAQLAPLAYQAGQTRKAELASKKALALAPKDDREQIKAAARRRPQAAAVASRRAATPRTDAPTPVADRASEAASATVARYPVSPRPYSSTGRAADS